MFFNTSGLRPNKDLKNNRNCNHVLTSSHQHFFTRKDIVKSIDTSTIEGTVVDVMLSFAPCLPTHLRLVLYSNQRSPTISSRSRICKQWPSPASWSLFVQTTPHRRVFRFQTHKESKTSANIRMSVTYQAHSQTNPHSNQHI